MEPKHKQKNLGLKVKDKNGLIEVKSDKLKNDNNYNNSMETKYFIDFSKIKEGFKSKTGESITQKEFADLIGVSKQTISNWSRQASPPIVKTLKKISELTGLSINNFISKK